MLACSLGNRSCGILNGNPDTKLPPKRRPDAEMGSAAAPGGSCSRGTRGCGAETTRPSAALARCSKQLGECHFHLEIQLENMARSRQ